MLRLVPQLLRILRSSIRTGRWHQLKQVVRQGFSIALKGASQREVSLVGLPALKPGPPFEPTPLFQMAAGYWVSQAIYVAAKLGMADVLAGGPKSGQELAVATGADPQSLYRLLRALSGMGVFETVAADRFALAPLGQALRSGVPGSLRHMVLTLGEIHYEAWGHLFHSVKTGTPAFQYAFEAPLFEYLGRNPEAGNTFNEAMTDYSALVAYAVLLAYDFADVRSIVDVGGGCGELLTSILRVYPAMRGTVLDTPAVITAAEERLASAPTRDRCTLVAGNFLEAVPPGADVYLMSGVIHDWDEDHAISILRSCQGSMAERSRLLVIECVVPEGQDISFSKLLDLNMLVMNGGRERTKAEFRELLDAAGLRMTRVMPTLSPLSIVEAARKETSSSRSP
jgi:hypothetical protein